MSTDNPTPDDETDPGEELEHHLGGVAAVMAGAETFVRPDTGRFTVDDLQTETGGIVDVSLRSEGISARTILEPMQARELADRLEAAADAADKLDDLPEI